MFDKEPAMQEVFNILKENKGKMTVRQIHELRTTTKAIDVKPTRFTLNKLIDAGYVLRERMENENAVVFTYSACLPKTTAKPNQISRMVGVYTCPELRDFTGRAGAMDAYKIPSLHMGQRIPRGAQLTRP